MALFSAFSDDFKALPIDILIDWYEFTIKGLHPYQILKLWGIDPDHTVLIHSGQFHYNKTIVYKEKIKFMFCADEWDQFNEYGTQITTPFNHMGIHVILSGYACREFETMNISGTNNRLNDWLWLFDFCRIYQCNMTRIDIAFDSYSDKYYTVKRCVQSIKRGEVATKSRTAVITDKIKLEDGAIIGESVRIGSSSSECMCMIYNKLQERESANYVVDPDISHWYRCELRLRRQTANAVIKELFNNEKTFAYDCIGLLRRYIEFKKFIHLQTNKSDKFRMKNANWWDEFVNQAQKVDINRLTKQSSIQKKKDWIDLSVTKTLAMVFLADYDFMTNDDFSELLANGINKLKTMNIDQINEYRIEKGASVLTQKDLMTIQKKVLNANYFPF